MILVTAFHDFHLFKIHVDFLFFFSDLLGLLKTIPVTAICDLHWFKNNIDFFLTNTDPLKTIPVTLILDIHPFKNNIDFLFSDKSGTVEDDSAISAFNSFKTIWFFFFDRFRPVEDNSSHRNRRFSVESGNRQLRFSLVQKLC